MVAGPPCHGKKAAACAANPSRTSQYKLIPEAIRLRFSLPEGACVCKSKKCWRVFGMAEEPRKPGRPRKRAREEDPTTPVFAAVGVPSASASRSKPSIIVKIHSFKEARCVRRLAPAPPHACKPTTRFFATGSRR